MKPALIIGSTVADVTIRLPRLPHTGQDINISSQSMTLGGCAFNVSEMLRRFGLPYHLFSPVGSGIYGDFVRSRLREKEIPLLIPCPEEENGCCYCFVESTGERTFAALHGAEYRFKPQWFDLLDPKELGPVYVCGLELEEDTGEITWKPTRQRRCISRRGRGSGRSGKKSLSGCGICRRCCI